MYAFRFHLLDSSFTLGLLSEHGILSAILLYLKFVVLRDITLLQIY
jgi:hypothetical protein